MLEIEENCARLLRELRKKRGLTLRECEEQSEGRFKAVVMGSYERGTRAISLERLQEIADFYHVPIQYFFNQKNGQQIEDSRRFTFDLRQLKNAPYIDESFKRVALLLAHIIQKRSDWNGEVLSIRQADGELLPLITNDDEIYEKLDFHHIYFNTHS